MLRRLRTVGSSWCDGTFERGRLAGRRLAFRQLRRVVVRVKGRGTLSMRLWLLQGQCVRDGLWLPLSLGPGTGLGQHLRGCWHRVRGRVDGRRHQHAAITAARETRCVLLLLLAMAVVLVRVRVLHRVGARAEGRLLLPLLPLLQDLSLRHQVCRWRTIAVEAARLTRSRLPLRYLLLLLLLLPRLQRLQRCLLSRRHARALCGRCSKPWRRPFARAIQVLQQPVE